jgi:hypothetical protein
LLTAASVSAGALPFFDNFEAGLGTWQAGGSWGLATEGYASPSHAATDSPGSYYTNNTDAALAQAVSLDLSGAAHPALSFLHSYALEAGYDFGFVEVSTNGGSIWLAPALAAYTGNLGATSREQLDLSPYAGAASFRLRFRLVTDSSVVMNGWYVDDVRVAETPVAVTLRATQTNRNSVVLGWDQAAPTGFAAYRLYRSINPGVDWRSTRLVAELNSNSGTNATDITTSPKTRYYYRLAVVNTDGMVSLGNEITVTTLPGMDYPFVDNGESGPATWIADAPWALSDEDAASPARAWSDSPATNYANGLPSQALTLAAPLYLAGQAVAPVLSFKHKHDFAAGDSGNAEISVNFGADWTTLATFTGTATNDWRRARLSLSAYSNNTVLVRFRLTSGVGARADGWHVDDISVAESPHVIPPPTLDELTSHSMRVAWAANTNALFSHYAILRSTVPGAGINSTLAATVTNQGATSFTDTGLALDTVYYYRVYAVNAYGAFSPDSAGESSARTLNNPPPLADGFEASLLNWNVTGSWGLTTNYSHGGAYALTDSPQGNYDNSSDSAAQSSLNLNGTSWPVLRFWDRHRLVDGDWGRLEVSVEGVYWTAIYGVSGVRNEWGEQVIDLSRWKNQSNLRIRFRLITDGANLEDGWYVDDLTVTDIGLPLITLPFYEGFESGLTNWQHAGWALDTNGPFAGSYTVHDTVPVRISPSTELTLVLGGALRLTNVVNPQMTFRVRGKLGGYSSFRVHCSTDGGLNWPELSAANLDTGFNSDWVRKQVSLQPYTNQTVRLRFCTSGNEYAPDEDIFLDQVAIEDAPSAVVLNPLDEITISTMRLTWTAATFPGFKEYRVYRSEAATVNDQSTLLAVITNAAATAFTDTGLQARRNYYYKVYVYDLSDTGNESNQSSAMTRGVPIPWSDDFESSQLAWTRTGFWTNQAGAGRNGSAAMVDSAGDYRDSTDAWAVTGVDLTGTRWPVLRFWDRYALADGDWGRLEISVEGVYWTPIYGASGTRNDWQEQVIDLSPWKNRPQVWIRFRMMTDGAMQADGWYVDDVSLAENTAMVAYPVYETFERGMANWLHAGWVTDTNQPYAGANAAHDTVPVRIPPDTQLALTLAGELNLTNAFSPALTYWVRGHLGGYSGFRVQVSTDGGLNWPELSALNLDTGYTSDWARKQISLAAYTNQTIRLRFVSNGNSYAPDEDIFLDNIGVGEPAPDAPTLSAPTGLSSVGMSRPALVVSNAVDYQGDALSYRYEVYADAGLTNLVAQVPVVAAGSSTTVWPVDVDLPNNAQYWWRCRASDGAAAGSWMATASFFVNEINHPPLPVVIAGPPTGTLITNLTERLVWYPTSDADVGDFIACYQLQADDDPLFASPAINETNLVLAAAPAEPYWTISLALQDLAGSSSFAPGTTYFWRVRALDRHALGASWSAGMHTFQYGIAPPRPATFAGLRRGTNGTMSLQWYGAAGDLYVEYSLLLYPANWQTIAGPLHSTNWTFTPVPGARSGFYRVRSQ